MNPAPAVLGLVLLMAGPAPLPAEGTETIDAAEIAPDVFFISWLEESGVSVSNVVDFPSKTVYAFVTFDADGSRQATFDRGHCGRSPSEAAPAGAVAPGCATLP